MSLGTCSCAVVRCVLCVLSGFVAPGGHCGLAPVCVPWLWPAACLSGVPRGPAWCAAPRPVRSLSGLRSAFRRRGAFPHPGGLGPRLYWAAARGTRRPAENRAHCACRWPPVVPVQGPAMGLSLAGPSGAGLGLRALRWLACVDPVTDASGFPYRWSFDRGLGRCTWAVSCGRRHLPLRVRGRHARVPCVCACARPSRPGRAGRPPGRVLVRLTFSFGRFVFPLCWPPPGWGCPCFGPFFALTSPLLLLFCCCFFPPLLCAPVVSGFLWFAARGALGLGAVFCLFFSASRCPPLRALSPRVCLPLGRWLLSGGCPPPPPLPPPLLCLAVFVAPARCRVFFCFFFFLCAPPLSPAFSGFRIHVPWASALCDVCFAGLPLLGSPCAFASFVLSAWPLAAPWWLPPPPPLCVSRFSSLPLSAVCRVLCCAVCPWVRCCAALLRVVPPSVVLSCAVLLCCAGLVPLRCPLWLRRALWRCPSPWGPVLCGAVLCGVPPCCMLCAACVLSWRGGACCCLPLCFVLCVSRGAVLCVPCLLRSVRCCASLCWCACVVLFVWCMPLLAPRAVVQHPFRLAGSQTH